jgi:hypoxanthine phosphoribosyltransferase
MTVIRVKDKEFEPFIPAGEIEKVVQQMADRINTDFEGKNPLFLAVLNGSFVFAADLLRKISIPCNISFVKFSSYAGTSTTAEVKELIGLNEEIKDRHVIIVEDIIDTGITMDLILENLRKLNPASLKIACFCHKPDAFTKSFKIDYLGMSIPNEFIVGYGLDYDGFGRNLPDIYKIMDYACLPQAGITNYG